MADKCKETIYSAGFFHIRKLSPEEVSEYKRMSPGVTFTSEMIRSVAVKDGEIRVIEQTADGISQIRIDG